MIINTKTILNDQNGAAIVEFAIILPLLILLIFGIIEFSLLVFDKQVITSATREGTRLGVIVKIPRVTDQEIKDQVKGYAKKHLVTFGTDTLEDANIDILPPGRCQSFGCDLKVEVTYNYRFLILDSLGFGPIPLKSGAIMRME